MKKPTDDNDPAWHDYYDDMFVCDDPLPEGVTRRTHYLQKVVVDIALDRKRKEVKTSECYRWITRPRMHCVLSRKAD